MSINCETQYFENDNIFENTNNTVSVKVIIKYKKIIISEQVFKIEPAYDLSCHIVDSVYL